MLKTLASLFKAQESEEEKTTEVVEPTDATPETAPEVVEEKEAGVDASAALQAQITELQAKQSDVQAKLEAAETELRAFGATAEERTAFLAEAKQLNTWYQNVTSLGIKQVQADANEEAKGKKAYKSAVTKEAEAIAAKKK